MPIPDSQLIAWSSCRQTAVPRQTYELIERALTSEQSRIKTRNFEIYLQGSSINGTNISDDCDVDVVVQLNDPLDLLPGFREDLQATLSDFFSAGQVEAGRRVFKLFSRSGEPIADVLPCCRYLPSDRGDVEGIQFFTTKGEWEHRFPKLNHQNGVAKDLRTDGNYKRWIRIFKNARLHLNEKLVKKRTGSSFFLECLLYNVPDSQFCDLNQHGYMGILDHLQKADLSRFLCQHEQHTLFGTAAEQWEIKKAQKLIRAFAELWEKKEW